MAKGLNHHQFCVMLDKVGSTAPQQFQKLSRQEVLKCFAASVEYEEPPMNQYISIHIERIVLCAIFTILSFCTIL